MPANNEKNHSKEVYATRVEIMEDYGKFGPLLGVISVCDTFCKFYVYAARNAEVLTCHEIKLKQIVLKPSWIELKPLDIWTNVCECIKVCCQNLIFLDINPRDIVSIGICSQRGTTILWNKQTGQPIYNAIGWADTRSSAIVKNILYRVKNNKNYLSSACGLPISNCFSAIKLNWLLDNIPNIKDIIEEGSCLFGTLDSWIIWNLTGGIENGIHITDVTNASYTMLMNLHTLRWDRKLCSFFHIPQQILPNIKSCSEIYGFIHDGPLQGIPIASCMGDQTAALLGQMCIFPRQSTCTIDDGCFLLVNTGQEIIESENGLLSTVGFKLGPNEKVFYVLEGAVANAGSAVSWLRDNLQINTDPPQNNSLQTGLFKNFIGDSSMVSSICSNSASSRSDQHVPNKGRIVFVPAFSGLYSPFWKHDARGLILGVNSQTTSDHVISAAYEATCFQIRDILESLNKDTPTWKSLKKIIVGGEFSESSYLLQMISDICGIEIERPHTTSSSCLGVMLAAGMATGILSLATSKAIYMPPSDTFQPLTSINEREISYKRWKYAIQKCVKWDNFEKFDEEIATFSAETKDPLLPIRCSIPGSVFITSSFILILIANFLKNQNIT